MGYEDPFEGLYGGDDMSGGSAGPNPFQNFGLTEADRQAAKKLAFMRAGMGVLAANKPGPYPHNSLSLIAQGGMQGLDSYGRETHLRTEENRRQGLAGMQASRFQSQQALAEQAAARKKRLGEIMTMESQQKPSGISDQAAASIGAPWAAASQIPQSPSSPIDGYKEKASLLAKEGYIAEANQVADFVKKMQPDLEFKDGVWYNKQTGAPVRGGVVMSPTGQAVQMGVGPGGFSASGVPGASDLMLSQARINEQARAERDPMLGVLDPQNRPIPQTREGFVQQYGTPGVRPQGAVPSAPAAPVGRGMGMTPGQLKTSQELAGKDVERVTTLEQKIPSLVSLDRRLVQMESLTADDKTYAAKGSELKTLLGSVVQGFGLKVNEQKTANTEEYIVHVAELLKDRLASKDYGSGTGVSNLDLLAAERPLPATANTAQGRRQIIAAIRADTKRALDDAVAARDYFGANNSLRNFRYPSELEKSPLPKTPGQAPAQRGQSFDTRPPANQYKGKIIRDKETGKRFQSDGMGWKELK
jgi:hypothetical protein